MRVRSHTHLTRVNQRGVGAAWLAVSASCAAFGTAQGADVVRETRTLEEVIVTAQKREERLENVPISITVMDGNALDRSTAESVGEALTRVPGVAVSDIFLGGGSQLTVRGVTASLALFQGASPIAYYLDSVPFGFVKTALVPDSNPYDLARVEVLRGPQGTLYGATALNGVVHVITRDANLETFEFKARTSGSSTDGGGENYRADAAVNVPLVESKLGVRAVVGYQDQSGWIGKPNDRSANDAENRNARIKINAQPTNNLSIGLSAWMSRDDFGAPSISRDNEVSASILPEPIATDYDAYGLRVAYDFSTFTLVSNTSYLEFSNESMLDLIPGSGVDFRLHTDLDAETFAEEVILSSRLEGAWRWTLGGIYRDSKDVLFQFLPGAYVEPTDIDNLSKSYAIFGEVTRVLLDRRLELTVGLRYFEDDVGQREHGRLTGTRPLLNTDRTFDATTPRVVATWHPTGNATLYASYSQGFRSGSDQIPTVLTVAPIPPAKPDELTNYELGAKGSVLDGRLSYEAAVYYIDWQDVQLPIAVNVAAGVDLQTIINGESASGPGADLGLFARPVDGLELGITASWNDLTVDEDVLSGGILLFPKGGRLSYSPEYTLGASADYLFPMWIRGYEGLLSLSANYTSVRGVAQLGAGFIEGDAMTVGRVSFGVKSPGRWTATLFADNVNNEQDTPVRSTFADWNARIRPRTIGVQFEYDF